MTSDTTQATQQGHYDESGWVHGKGCDRREHVGQGCPEHMNPTPALAASIPTSAPAGLDAAEVERGVKAIRDEFYAAMPPGGHPIVYGFSQRVLDLIRRLAPSNKESDQ